MLNLPFLHKDSFESQKYVFILFLSGNRIYGFAFEEDNAKNRSVLYQEPVDPFLKNTASKIEKIIANCEQDLGENVYLKKTVLVLNSFYTTESGAIKENFLKEIKDLLKKVDLDNLGYLNFYEAVVNDFTRLKNYFFLEESFYDYSVYEIKDESIKKVHKIAKTADSQDSLKTIKKLLGVNAEVVAWLEKSWQPQDLAIKYLLSEEKLIDLFTKIYFKDKQLPSEKIEAPSEQIQSNGLLIAPGFSNKSIIEKQTDFGENLIQSDEHVSDFAKPKFTLPKLNWSLVRASFSKKTWFFLISISLVVLFLFYLFLFHQATIILETKKENFSSNTEFTVKPNSDFVRPFVTNVNLTVGVSTSGEKITGEKAKGEITIYNGLFEKKELAAGFNFKTNNGVVFVTDEAVLVPGATTSANLDEGLITTAFGKKSVSVTALEIGAEGNLNNGTKLITDEYDSDDFYGLTNEEFSGGVKKIVAVFANKDAIELEKKALTLSKNKVLAEFAKNHASNDVLFTETISTTGVKKDYSAKVNDEANRVTLSYEGQVKAFFAPYKQLVDMVQKQKLKDKEFVDNTFTLSKIKLIREKDGFYQYSAIIKGQIQNFFDRKALLNNLKGRLTLSAQKTLEQEHNIIEYEIRTAPLPLPILPFRETAIKFEF